MPASLCLDLSFATNLDSRCLPILTMPKPPRQSTPRPTCATPASLNGPRLHSTNLPNAALTSPCSTREALLRGSGPCLQHLANTCLAPALIVFPVRASRSHDSPATTDLTRTNQTSPELTTPAEPCHSVTRQALTRLALRHLHRLTSSCSCGSCESMSRRY